jgi:hypothetical protein
VNAERGNFGAFESDTIDRDMELECAADAIAAVADARFDRGELA